MPRQLWKGAIRFGLVHVPVSLYPAEERDWPTSRRRQGLASGKPYALRLDMARALAGIAPLSWREADPFGREWVPDATPWTGVPGSLVWYIQVALIVWGHVVAVFEAHRVSLGVHVNARRAVMAQVPLILLMVGYTFTGLWVLGQVLAAP